MIGGAYVSCVVVADLIAGITVGLLLIPQSLAYAIIANLPPIYGLYTAWVRA